MASRPVLPNTNELGVMGAASEKNIILPLDNHKRYSII